MQQVCDLERHVQDLFSCVIAFFSSSVIFIYSGQSTLSPLGCSFCMYKKACFDVLKKTLTMTNSLSASILFSSCIILRSALSLGYQKNMALAWLLKFFGMAENDCVSNHK